MVENDYFDCYLSLIAEILDKKKMKYNYLNIGRWDFSYIDSNDKVIGKKIEPYKNNRKSEIFLDYYGIKTEWYEKESFSDIKRIESESFVLIKVDLFDCHWTKAYLKNHYDHYILVKELNGNNCICDDSYFKYYNWTCTRNQLNDLVKAYVIINFKKINHFPYYIKSELTKDASFFYRSINHLELFINDMNTKYNVMTEIEEHIDDIYATPLLDNINIILRKKKSYSIMLSHASNDIDIDIEEVYNKSLACINSWKQLKLIIIKNCLTKQDFGKKIRSKLEDIYIKEIEFRHVFYKTMINNR